MPNGISDFISDDMFDDMSVGMSDGITAVMSSLMSDDTWKNIVETSMYFKLLSKYWHLICNYGSSCEFFPLTVFRQGQTLLAQGCPNFFGASLHEKIEI